MSFLNLDSMVSTGVATSECDIRINHNNTCKIIVAANDATPGLQRLFYTFLQGAFFPFTPSVLPLVPGDLNHRHPSVEWTSDDIAWAVTVATGIVGTTMLRCYKTINPPILNLDWQQDQTFSVDHKNVDRPRMCVDHSQSDYQDRIYVIWIHDQSVFVTFRDRVSGTWQPPAQVSGAETTNGEGCDIKTNASGQVFAFWRDTGSRQLFVARSDDGGNTFSTKTITPNLPYTYASSTIRIPSCRSVVVSISGGAYQTINQAVGNDSIYSKGFVYAVWTDLSGDSGCDSPSSSPDASPSCKTRIWFARSFDNGDNWGSPYKVNDNQSLNDQFHPRLVVDETNGQLVLLYYDTVNDLVPRRSTNVWMQTSEDNGVSWSYAFMVNTAETDETTSGATAHQYGDYIGLTGYAGTFFAAWTDRRSGLTEQIWARQYRSPYSENQLTCSSFSTDPILTSATIEFHTGKWDDGGDDKDWNTHVRVDLCTVRDEIAAYIDSNLGGPLPSGTDGTYSLQVNGPRFSKSRIQQGYVHIRIDTVGDDTWDFSFTLKLRYTNGDTTSVDAPASTDSERFYVLSDDHDFRNLYIRTRDGHAFWWADSI